MNVWYGEIELATDDGDVYAIIEACVTFTVTNGEIAVESIGALNYSAKTRNHYVDLWAENQPLYTMLASALEDPPMRQKLLDHSEAVIGLAAWLKAML